MIWLSLCVVVVAAATVLAVVGGVLSWAVGLRGYWAVAAAPAFALTVIGIASTAAPWVGLAWSPIPVLAVTALLAVVLRLARRALGLSPGAIRDGRARVDSWLGLGLALAFVFITWRICVVIGDPGNFSQTFDNIFHLNAVRYVLDTGNASSLHLGRMTSPSGTLPFYPAAWHAFTALVVGMTGASIPVGVNGVTIVIAALIWPLGAVLLARTLFGTRPLVSVAAGVTAAVIPAFPFLLMDYGVLYPFQLGLALLPVGLAAALRAMGLVSTAAPALPKPWWALILAGTVPGMTLAHPGAFVALLALTLPMVVAFAWSLLRTARSWRRLAVIAGLVVYLGAGLALLRILRPPAEARGWPPTLSIGEAIGQVVTVSMWYAVPVLVVAVAVLAGVVWSVIVHTRPSLLALAMYVIAAGLFVVVSAVDYWPLRDVLTGSWYNNIPRLAAILPITMVPLAALGVDRTWALVKRSARRAPATRRRALAVAGAAVGAAAVVAAAVPVSSVTAGMYGVYAITADSALVSTDESALLARLDDHVPPGATVAGSPWTGTSLAYALAGRPVLMPHTLMEISPELEQINDGLDTAVAGDEVCRALQDRNVRFVLDFGSREVFPGQHDYPGLDALATSGAVTPVDSEGDARLYEITACGS